MFHTMSRKGLVAVGAAILGDVDAVVAHAYPRVRAMAGLASLDDGALRALMAQVVSTAVQALFVDGTELADAQLSVVAEGILEEQARAGLRVEDAQEASYVLVEELWLAGREAAAAVAADPDVLGEVGDVLLAFLQQANRLIAAVFRSLDAAAARADARRRDAFIHRLVTGQASEAEAREHGLQPARVYSVAVGAPDADGTLADAVRRVGGLAGAVAGNAVALVAGADPVIDAPDITVGLGPPCSIADATRSYRAALICAATGRRFERRGAVRINDLGLLPLMADDALVTPALVDRYITPLQRLGTFGTALLETLHALMANGMRLEPTARQLNIHINTLRHRVDRYERAVSRRLRDTDTIVELWWALTASSSLTSDG
jgi:hypothetical protein